MNRKKSGVVTLISDKADFRNRKIIVNSGKYDIMVKGRFFKKNNIL